MAVGCAGKLQDCWGLKSEPAAGGGAAADVDRASHRIFDFTAASHQRDLTRDIRIAVRVWFMASRQWHANFDDDSDSDDE